MISWQKPTHNKGKNPFCSLVKVCGKAASFNSHQERAVTYLKILEDPIQEPYTFIESMIANNLCRHLILNSVEHSVDAVLFLINVLPPLSKCTVVFGENRKRLWIKLNPYEIRFFFFFFKQVFQSRILRNTCLLL